MSRSGGYYGGRQCETCAKHTVGELFILVCGVSVHVGTLNVPVAVICVSLVGWFFASI